MFDIFSCDYLFSAFCTSALDLTDFISINRHLHSITASGQWMKLSKNSQVSNLRLDFLSANVLFWLNHECSVFCQVAVELVSCCDRTLLT